MSNQGEETLVQVIAASANPMVQNVITSSTLMALNIAIEELLSIDDRKGVAKLEALRERLKNKLGA